MNDPEEQYTASKLLDSSNSSDIAYNILVFLEASPLTLFTRGTPSPTNQPISEEMLQFFTSYLISGHGRLRYLANIIACKIMTEGTIPLYRMSKNTGLYEFRHRFWKAT
jgi:neurofibromin 1